MSDKPITHQMVMDFREMTIGDYLLKYADYNPPNVKCVSCGEKFYCPSACIVPICGPCRKRKETMEAD